MGAFLRHSSGRNDRRSKYSYILNKMRGEERFRVRHFGELGAGTSTSRSPLTCACTTGAGRMFTLVISNKVSGDQMLINLLNNLLIRNHTRFTNF